LEQNSNGEIDNELCNWLITDNENTFNFENGKKLLYSDFEEGEDIFYNHKKLIRIISKHFGDPNIYNGSADWGGANVWSIKGDRFYGTFIYFDDNEVCLLDRTFDEKKDKNVDLEILKANETYTLSNLIAKALTY
jgi:hypothetical protein